MSTSPQQRLRDWIAAPAYPWITGGAVTVGAVVELIAVPGGVTTTVGVLVSAASLMWRRSFPPVAMLTVAAGLIAFAGDVNLYVSIMVSGLTGCYSLGRNRVLHPALTVAGGALGAVCVNLVHINTWSRMDLPVPALWEKGSLSLFAESFLLTVVVFGAVMMGDAVRSREETRTERSLAQAKLIAMERQQAAEAERAAIARELHDIVSHSVSMIAVQAESATYTTPGLTPEARDGFQQIAGTARSSMAELRRLLGVLRTPPGDTGPAALTAPQPTLDHLAELVEQHRAVGGPAELRVTGERVALPAAWELSAYRIAQEALTNARKHAPGARTVVEVDYGAGRLLTLRVRDDGPGTGPGSDPGSGPDSVPGTGHGLTGMRERAALVGGRLTAGAGPDGGFLVEAELPWGSG
ncbi:two-component sensor histidine kinase [Streptomyces coelicoflavus]|uniref:histidine kinase n=1 Tax=Streptomyces coelicoflavus TaxID=285562 RepID=A0A7K3PK40_9ACTN|nr:histidine kinase [Streptomyces coelicoflavus]NEB09629.1 two-component sensor histidine kinase [Streptomyces coelicoflavus]